MYQSKKYNGVFYSELQNGDKSYYIKYFVNRKQYKKQIGKYSEGIRENFCAAKRVEYINEAKFGNTESVNIGLDDLADRYHDTKTTNGTYDDMISRYDFKIKPFFKNKLVSKITEEDIYAFQKALIKTKTGSKGKGGRYMSAATVNYYVTQVSSLLKFGVSKGFLGTNVARNVKPLKEDNSRTRYLEKDELKELVEAVQYDEDLLMFVEISMSTGARMSAVMSIRKKDINMPNKSVSIEDEKGGGFYTAFLNERVLKLLKVKLVKLKPNDRIYDQNIRRMQRQMKKVLDLLFNEGLLVEDAKNRVVIHTLRHSFASHLAINGTPIFTIQKLLNHKDIKQTMRYAKLSPDSGREQVESIWG